MPKLIIEVEIESSTDTQLEVQGLAASIASTLNSLSDEVGAIIETSSIKQEVVTVTHNEVYPLIDTELQG